MKANLAGAQLKSANLTGAKLFEANLQDADISGADLSRANGDGIKLSGATAKKTVFKGAVLAGATIEGAAFVQSDMTDVSLENSLIAKCEFYSCELTGLRLHGSTLKDLVIQMTNLGQLEATNITFVKTETEPPRELKAVFSGKIADFKWPVDKKYGWRAGLS
jgi:uncharacterized protein YjbI with pentapeptide repeats